MRLFGHMRFMLVRKFFALVCYVSDLLTRGVGVKSGLNAGLSTFFGGGFQLFDIFYYQKN